MAKPRKFGGLRGFSMSGGSRRKIRQNCRNLTHNTQVTYREYESEVESHTYTINKQSDIVVFYNNRGNAYYKMCEHEKAISDYSEAIKLNFAFKEAYLNRSQVYYLVNEIERAKADEKIAANL